MNSTAVVSTITQLLPEIIAFIKGFFTASGTMPTDAQVIAQLGIDEARVTAISNAWLAANTPSTSPASSTPGQ
jgi:hypothetical protein